MTARGKRLLAVNNKTFIPYKYMRRMLAGGISEPMCLYWDLCIGVNE